jgi:hypothetical protein
LGDGPNSPICEKLRAPGEFPGVVVHPMASMA